MIVWAPLRFVCVCLLVLCVHTFAKPKPGAMLLARASAASSRSTARIARYVICVCVCLTLPFFTPWRFDTKLGRTNLVRATKKWEAAPPRCTWALCSRTRFTGAPRARAPPVLVRPNRCRRVPYLPAPLRWPFGGHSLTLESRTAISHPPPPLSSAWLWRSARARVPRSTSRRSSCASGRRVRSGGRRAVPPHLPRHPLSHPSPSPQTTSPS